MFSFIQKYKNILVHYIMSLVNLGFFEVLHFMNLVLSPDRHLILAQTILDLMSF